MVNKEIAVKVRNYLHLLVKGGITISLAYIFGSRVNQADNDESDINVLIVSPLFDENADQYAGQLWKTAGEVDYKIEPYPVGEKRFNNSDSPLLEMVKATGVEIKVN